jgi:hypothetical protein
MLEKIKNWFKSIDTEVAYDPQVVEAATRDKVPLPPGPRTITQYELCEKGRHEYGKWQMSAGYFFQRRYCKHCNYCQEKSM